VAEHYQRPGWFTTNVFNRIVAAMTRMGVSVYGSRVLEVRGRRSGEWRQTPKPCGNWQDFPNAGLQTVLDCTESRFDCSGMEEL